MAGDAQDTVARFWEIQNGRDYSKLSSLFAADAVLEDPIYGTFEGREAIAAFMQKMNEEMGGQNIHFTLEQLSGDNETAWAQWIAHTPRGDIEGVGVYRVRDGLLTYYRDYMNTASTPTA